MKPQQLYDMEPNEVSHRPAELIGCYYNHVEESGLESWDIDWDIESDRLEIKVLKDHCFDGRRIWRLATVWFDGKPIMVTQNAGREGDDHRKRFITDEAGFRDMCGYLATLKPIEEITDLKAPDEEVDGLDEFYGHKLGGMFEIHTY